MVTTTRAFIIGNGVTRKDFDLNLLKKTNIPVFGCNALYRNFQPDYLIAIDEKMIDEINEKVSSNIEIIIPPEEERYEPVEYNPSQPRNNAGMIAMNEAIKRGHNFLYCIGMDFIIEDKELNVQNIYEGTNAYEQQTRASYWDTISRLKFFEWYANKHPEVHFRFLFPRDNYHFRTINSPNVSGQFFEKFFRELESA